MRYTKTIAPLLIALAVAACSSAPTWEGYSPTEAANLQALGLSPAEANEVIVSASNKIASRIGFIHSPPCLIRRFRITSAMGSLEAGR